MRRPLSRSSSQIGVFHSGGPPLSTSPPQMSLTSTSMWPCSARIRSASAAHLVGVEVVDRDRDPGAAERGDQLGRLLDGLRPVVVGPERARPAAAAGADDRRAGLAQRGGDAPARAAGRAGDHRHPSPQRLRIR